MAVPLDYQNHYKAIYVSPCFFSVTASFSPKRLKIRLTPNSTSLPAVFFHLFPPRAMASCPLFPDVVSPENLRHLRRAHWARRGGETSTAEWSLPRADDEAPWNGDMLRYQKWWFSMVPYFLIWLNLVLYGLMGFIQWDGSMNQERWWWWCNDNGIRGLNQPISL